MSSENPEKHIESLNKAIKNMRIADHILYVTYPVIKDKRLLLKSLEEVYDAIVLIINSILQYDYLQRRIELANNPQHNLDIFITKCAKRYNLTTEELDEIINLINLMQNHKKSPMEFTRKDKVIILSESLKTTAIDSEKLKKYLYLAKNLINKAKFGMSL
jgi:hypothetical protein